MKKYISNSVEDTFNIAKELKGYFNNGDTILLDGDLGAGKTQFVKKVVKAFGGDENLVTSPTFTLVNEYVVNGLKIYHFDLYRIKSVEELFNIGIEEYLYSDAICFVEWPERASELFLTGCKKISILKTGETSREIIFKEME